MQKPPTTVIGSSGAGPDQPAGQLQKNVQRESPERAGARIDQQMTQELGSSSALWTT
jgi:hypothetical protein